MNGTSASNPPKTTPPSAKPPNGTVQTPAVQGTSDPLATATTTSAETFPFSVTVTPQCVTRGGAVTFQATTLPRTQIAYVAEYSDGKSGAAPPWGAGYGGNAGGEAGSDGRYTSTWTVSPTAPAGLVLVTATAGAPNGMSRDASATFAVAGPTGRC